MARQVWPASLMGARYPSLKSAPHKTSNEAPPLPPVEKSSLPCCEYTVPPESLFIKGDKICIVALNEASNNKTGEIIQFNDNNFEIKINNQEEILHVKPENLKFTNQHAKDKIWNLIKDKQWLEKNNTMLNSIVKNTYSPFGADLFTLSNKIYGIQGKESLSIALLHYIDPTTLEVDYSFEQVMTLLMISAQENRRKHTEFLLNNQATLSIENSAGQTAFSEAVLNGSYECAKLILNHAIKQGENEDIFGKNFLFNDYFQYIPTPLTLRKETLEYALDVCQRNCKEIDQKEHLTNTDAVKFLSSFIWGKDDFTPADLLYLHKALNLCKDDNLGNLILNFVLFQYHTNPNPNILEKLFLIMESRGCDFNQEIDFSMTPLMLSAKHGYIEHTKQLLTMKTNLSLETTYGYTAFFEAILNENYDCAKLILKHAQTTRKNVFGNSTQGINKLIILDRIPDDMKSEVCDYWSHFSGSIPELSDTVFVKDTAMRLICDIVLGKTELSAQEIDSISQIISCCPDIDLYNDIIYLACNILCQKTQKNISIALLSDISFAYYDFNQKDSQTMTLLMRFSQIGSKEHVELFLTATQDLSIVNSEDHTAFMEALLNGHHDCALLILKHAAKQDKKENIFGETILTKLFHDDTYKFGVNLKKIDKRKIKAFEKAVFTYVRTLKDALHSRPSNGLSPVEKKKKKKKKKKNPPKNVETCVQKPKVVKKKEAGIPSEVAENLKQAQFSKKNDSDKDTTAVTELDSETESTKDAKTEERAVVEASKARASKKDTEHKKKRELQENSKKRQSNKNKPTPPPRSSSSASIQEEKTKKANNMKKLETLLRKLGELSASPNSLHKYYTEIMNDPSNYLRTRGDHVSYRYGADSPFSFSWPNKKSKQDRANNANVMLKELRQFYNQLSRA